MSTGVAEMLREDLENLGPVKVSDVEVAQQKIIKVVKRVEGDGTIVIAGAGGSNVALKYQMIILKNIKIQFIH